METKKDIRKRILKSRNELDMDSRIEKSKVICEKLINHDAYQKAANVLCFISYQSEVVTDEIIYDCIKNGKNVYAPTVCGEDMRFFRIDSIESLIEGYKGIREPVIEETREYTLSKQLENDIIIMPGSVFDKERNRLGYGRGFYDRYLSKGFKGTSVALAYQLQIVDEGSFEVYSSDIKPQLVITEEEII